jgi:hypothetical protein
MSALQDRRRALRLATGVALAGIVGSATVGRSGVTLVLDAEAKKKKKKKQPACGSLGPTRVNECVAAVNSWCNTNYAADLNNCLASYNGCCDIAVTCDFAGAQSCLDQSPYQVDPTP